jgi:hypothetical protein
MSKERKLAKGTGAKRVKRILRRVLIVLLLVVVLAASALVLVMNLVFNGPSPAARNVLTMSLIEASATKWVPGVFLDEEIIAEIRTGKGTALENTVSDASIAAGYPPRPGELMVSIACLTAAATAGGFRKVVAALSR